EQETLQGIAPAAILRHRGQQCSTDARRSGHRYEKRQQRVAARQCAVEIEGGNGARHSGRRRNTKRGRWRRTAMTTRIAGGTHTMSVPRAIPRTVAVATSSAVTDIGATLRPAVIFVVTNPGRTIITRTPLPAIESPSPW